MSLEKEGVTDAILARVKPIGEHRFNGMIQCESGFFYGVKDGVCLGCGKKLRIVVD